MMAETDDDTEKQYRDFENRSRDSTIETLEHRLEEQQREIERLRDEVGDDDKRDRRGLGGTPNLSGDVAAKIKEGPPSEYELDSIDDKKLHRALSDGPEAFVDESTPIYPVHKRAHEVLVHAAPLARSESEDGSTIFLTVPTVKRFLEAREDDRLKHTQVRRVFETIEQAGSEYPRPPTLHKNRDGVIELAIFDYPALFNQSLLS